jgi:hypothetical protein
MPSSIVRMIASCAVVFTLSACRAGVAPGESANDWARAALQRNPHIELLASDPAGVFTVRDRRSGEIETIELDQLAAVPLSQLAPESIHATPAPSPVPRPGQIPDSQTQTTPSTAHTDDDASTGIASVTPPPPAGMGAPDQDRIGDGHYTIERRDGQVRVTGPGISIVSAAADATEADRRHASAHTDEPIICEGRRMLHLDNRDLRVEGDAIIARGGCSLYITNSRIVASGTGIVVRDATVHVSNSHVEGADGAFDVDDSARMFVRSSTFQGVPKRTELALVQDQGGNRWR